MADDTTSMSIYRASRTIKKKHSSLFNSLLSIHEDSIFVSEIAQLWPELPLVANLRCGLWYAKKFHSNCYFKTLTLEPVMWYAKKFHSNCRKLGF
ncbi:putative tRNA A64-2'-O-ribosylphosphate transferase, rit1 domain-containing protein [Helianthus annuus]|nr:putative tRNA A64-2'-O-ribosylphosphate transferase, rit1 domain-containing protein [Helianthus annuus]